ncbi:MAG: hypothetical protein ABSD90_02115 [Methylocystis sp.]|jgi:hypothetical protein
MRRAISAMVFAICAFWCFPLWAVTVSTEAQLRAAPNVHARVLAVLAEGVEVIVESIRQGARHDWTFVTVAGLRGYVPAAELAPQPYASTLAAENPHCDLGYPYSGSSVYFTGLTELRTSEPLGALLGYHVQRPC